MDAQLDLIPISIDPRAYLFFPNGIPVFMQINSKRQPLIKVEQGFSTMAKFNMMNIKKGNLESSINLQARINIKSITNFGLIKCFLNFYKEMDIRTSRHIRR